MKVTVIQDVKINLYKWGRYLIFLTFFIQFTQASPLKIAILDTGFCPSLIKHETNISINSPIDLTSSVKLDCKKYSNSNRRFHGQWVLQQFLKVLKTSHKIEITPFIIFDSTGSQKESYWKTAFLQQDNFHLFITAAGVQGTSKFNITRPIFVAGATLGRGIRKSSKLWPQSEFKNKLVFKIGSYLPKGKNLGKREDYTLLRKKEMSYFFSSGSSEALFKGSSRAVATASARAVNLCYEKLFSLKGLAECLKKKRFKIKLDESHRELLSF
jgi:hypothetical protein